MAALAESTDLLARPKPRRNQPRTLRPVGGPDRRGRYQAPWSMGSSALVHGFRRAGHPFPRHGARAQLVGQAEPTRYLIHRARGDR
jgi:hypothetical protein